MGNTTGALLFDGEITLHSPRSQAGGPPIASPETRRALIRLLGASLTFRLRRYTIAEESMAPSLMPGDRVAAVKSPRRVAVGDVVVFEIRPGFEVVKRVSPAPAGVDGLWVLGDNPGAGSVDSRTFGTVDPARITARVELRTHPRPWATV